MPQPTNLDSANARELEAIYKHHLAELSLLATSQFNLSHSDAEAIARDVLISALGSSSRIPNLTTWLQGAMTNAAARHGVRQ
jgi:DNA-directed RNA polymerase specialized sigma24 family protein